MDYAKEIAAFTDWLETNPLDSTAQLLWLHLMAMWHKSGYPEWFTVANPTLVAKLGVTDKTLTKHRNTLVQKMRIEYRGVERVKGGKYRHLPLSDSSAVKIPSDHPSVVQSDGKITPEHSADHPSDVTPDHSADHPSEKFLLKDGKKEGKIDRVIDSRARDGETSWQTMQRLFQEIFGDPMTSNHYSIVNTYLDDGMELEVIISALEDAKTNNAEVPKYLWRTIGSWFTSGVKTVADYCRMIESQATNPPKRNNVVPLQQSAHSQSLQEKWANRGKKTGG